MSLNVTGHALLALTQRKYFGIECHGEFIQMFFDKGHGRALFQRVDLRPSQISIIYIYDISMIYIDIYREREREKIDETTHDIIELISILSGGQGCAVAVLKVDAISCACMRKKAI